MTVQFRNLVFEGGGVRGVAYAGAMRVLEQRGALENIQRVGGTSAGAINGLAFALGYTVEEQRDILFSTDFKSFMDDSAGLLRDVKRLRNDYGWHKGEYFRDWARKLVKDKLGKPDATFRDLKKGGRPDLFIIGANLNTGYAEIFSHERHPDMELADAVRISMSIPIVFAAVMQQGDVFVDGGVVMNYPVKVFDRERYIDAGEIDAARHTEYYNRENAVFSLQVADRSPYVYNRQTLGLRLDKREEIGLFRYNEPAARKKISSFKDFAWQLMSTLMQVQENVHLHSDDWHRTLYIDTLDVGTMDFGMDEATKNKLIGSGVACAEKYFQWFEDPNEHPKNRIDG